MSRAFYIETGDGEPITAGVPAHLAREAAQQFADERGESVFLYCLEDDGEAEEIEPITTDERIKTLRTEAAAAGDLVTVAICAVALARGGAAEIDESVRADLEERGIYAGEVLSDRDARLECARLIREAAAD